MLFPVFRFYSFGRDSCWSKKSLLNFKSILSFGKFHIPDGKRIPPPPSDEITEDPRAARGLKGMDRRRRRGGSKMGWNFILVSFELLNRPPFRNLPPAGNLSYPSFPIRKCWFFIKCFLVTEILWKLTCLSRVSCDNESEKVRRRRWSNSSLLFKYTSSNELSPGRWTPRDFFLDWFSLIGINDEISIFKRSTVRFRSILLKIGNLDRARTAILIWRAINAICMGNKDIGRRGVPTIRCP